MWGTCHCGCGMKTTVADVTSTLHGVTKGRPRVWVWGHSVRVYGAPKSPGSWHTHGTPAEQVRPLVEWLVARYGSQRQAARIVGVNISWPSYLLRGDISRVSPRVAEAVVAAVLAHRPRSQDPYRWHEVEPTHLPSSIRASIQDPERIRNTEQKRRSRERLAEAS